MSDMTEARTQTPDEALLSDRELPDVVTDSINTMLAFVQANDGFVGYGQFHFYTNGCEYAGQYESNDVSGTEKIDMTRRGEGVLDRSVVSINPNSVRTPHFIAYSDFANGRPMSDNSYGALRGTQGITEPPRQQGPAV